MPTCVGIYSPLFFHLTRTLVIRPTLFLYRGNRGVAAVSHRRNTPITLRATQWREVSYTDM
ncbi:hypothetical protein [Ktedonobacter robiniae]|uniref:Uncharacterized protein n=1 Tax=Ktedonobacter robiniae TaxID=2778365 RepID=A0ABQ3UK49_9CHLR|nr:hypothetical protein [Ktedonobacter robiniae]GHO53111.1 hypothetical protein KSB_15860 [Ktedonobacter robiniae]